MDLYDLRREYLHQGLHRKDLNPDPVVQFDSWFKQAEQSPIKDPSAMSLATANAQGEIGIRTVLLKIYDHKGFVFFTNYSSTKASHISENPHVA